MDDKKKISLQNKEYLVFEGGGGKGNAYLGAILVLEEKGYLPIRNNDSKKFIGVAGASAGAITALMVALGLSSDDIEYESIKSINKMDLYNGKGFEFNDFFSEDNPSPGAYRGIEIRDGKDLQIGYAIDGKYVDKEFNQTVADLRKHLTKQYNLDSDVVDLIDRRSLRGLKLAKIDVGKKIQSQPVRKDDPFIRNLYKYEFEVLMKNSKLLKKRLANILKEDPKNVIVKKIYSSFEDYMYNILYDRGLFTGTMQRNYFADLIVRYLNKYHNNSYIISSEYPRKELLKGNEITFSLFYAITGVDLRISCTNMTARKNVIFSKDNTADFPVSEAVGMSMNIPGLFKPVCIKDNRKSLAEENLTGLWVDGGLLNNFPFKAFSNIPLVNYNKVIGIKVTDGPDPVVYEKMGKDPWFTKDPTYKKYIEAYIKEKKALPNRKLPNSSQDMGAVDPSGIFGNTLFSVMGYLLNTWLEDATERQVPQIYDETNVLEVFSYHIGIVDFTPQKNLKEFVVEQARIRAKEKFMI